MLVVRYNWITFVSSVGSVHDVGPPDVDDNAQQQCISSEEEQYQETFQHRIKQPYQPQLFPIQRIDSYEERWCSGGTR
jgi:hypothetical protein